MIGRKDHDPDDLQAFIEEIRAKRPAGSGSWTSREFCRAKNEDGSEHVSCRITPQRGTYGSLKPDDAAFIEMMCVRGPQVLEALSPPPARPDPAYDIRAAAALITRCLRDPDWADMHVPGFREIDFQAVYAAMSEDHQENLRVCGVHDWPCTMIAGLECLSGEGDS